MEIKLAIVGSRTFDDYETFRKVVDEFLRDNNFKLIRIISGGCRGADTLANRLSQENDVDLITFMPEWGKYGKRAGLIRNQEIIKSCDVCLAFWDGISNGTSNAIASCKKFPKPCWIFNFSKGILYQESLMSL